jgi:hypothetical protein
MAAKEQDVCHLIKSNSWLHKRDSAVKGLDGSSVDKSLEARKTAMLPNGTIDSALWIVVGSDEPSRLR